MKKGVYLIHPPKVFSKGGQNRSTLVAGIIYAKYKSLRLQRFYFEVMVKLTNL